MKLRPHHLIDIITDHGHGVQYKPHRYGHALHTVAEHVMGNQDLEVEFVLAADDICAPCLHLLPDGRCDDVLPGSGEPVPKQAYNDRLDGKLFSYLEIQPGSRMTVRAFLERLGEHVPGIEHVCTHPREETGDRLEGLRKGLAKLGAE